MKIRSFLKISVASIAALIAINYFLLGIYDLFVSIRAVRIYFYQKYERYK
jgi:hypothetical protein